MPFARTRLRIRRRVVLALGLGVVGAVLIGELLLSRMEAFRPWPRYAPGERTFERSFSTFLQPDARVGWSMEPDIVHRHRTDEFDVEYRANAQGFRADRPYEPAAPGADDARVLLVGDSYTFGIGVEREDSFAGRLQADLGVPVDNLAMPGFAVDQMWIQVQYGLEHYAPSLVVVAVCDADLARSQTAFSLSNGMEKPTFRRAEDGLVPMTFDDRLNPVHRFFEERSRLWMGVRQINRLVGYRVPYGEWWHLNAAILETLDRACADAGVPWLLVYVPTPERRSFPTLRSWAERTGVPFVDLTEVLSGDGLFFPRDRHFTPAGHAASAEHMRSSIEPLLSAALAQR